GGGRGGGQQVPAKLKMVRLVALKARAEAARPRKRDECPPWFDPVMWESRKRRFALLRAMVDGTPEPEGVTDEDRTWAEPTARRWREMGPQPPRPPGDWTHEYARRFLRGGQ